MSPDVLKLCKVYNAVRVELLFLLDLVELSTVALEAAALADHTKTLTLPVAVDLLEKRGAMGVAPIPARGPPESRAVLCTPPHVHVPLSSL